jgi:DNA-binding FadR family transcriptional regulator
MIFEVVRRRKVYEDVASQIEAAITAGHYAEGDQLPSERDLMDQFGVGRPAIREALLILQRMGLVHLSTGERARVTQPTIHALVDQLSGAARHFLASPGGETAFQDARRVFESAIAYNAAEQASKNDITNLRHALEANRKALKDMVEFEKTDIRFHVELTKIGGNPIFLALHTAIVDWLSMQRHTSLTLPGVAEEAFKSHEKIFLAIEKRSPTDAWLAMDDHLKKVFQYVNAARSRVAG